MVTPQLTLRYYYLNIIYLNKGEEAQASLQYSREIHYNSCFMQKEAGWGDKFWNENIESAHHWRCEDSINISGASS